MVPFLIWETCKYPSVVVDPISVPVEFANMGYTPDVVARRLVDGINEFPADVALSNLCFQTDPDFAGSMGGSFPRGPVDLRYKRTVIGLPHVLPTHDPSKSDFLVPGMGLSIKAVAAFLRSRLDPPIIVSGELVYTTTYDWTTADSYVSLRLRVDGKRVGDMSRKKVDEKEIEQLFREGSNQAIDNVDPSKFDSKFANMFNNYGLLLFDKCNYGAAAEKFRKATKINPGLAESYSMWGYVLGVYLDDYEGAIEKFKRAVEIDPKYAGTYNNWGLLLVERNDDDDAIEKFERATEIDPEFAEAFYNWGYVLGIRKGKFVLATEKFETANSLRRELSR